MLERKNPLPVGRYWVDVIGDDQLTAWQAWLKKNATTVRVVNTQDTSGYDPVNDRSVTSIWVLFDVVEPTRWEGPGLPTVADAGVETKADTVQRPAPEPTILDEIKSASTDVLHIGGLILLLGALWYFSKRR